MKWLLSSYLSEHLSFCERCRKKNHIVHSNVTDDDDDGSAVFQIALSLAAFLSVIPASARLKPDFLTSYHNLK